MKYLLEKHKNLISILLLALTNIAIHLIFVDNLEYHRDELLYFSLGQHLDFGYMTVPPLIGWIAFIMKSLFGYSIFAVKLFPALLSGLLVFLSAAIARELGGNNYARILTGISIIVMPATLRAFHLFQPVHLDLFFWTLILYYSIRYINSKSDKYLIFIGLTIGFALLNKYLVLLLLISLLISIVFSEHRILLRKKYFYFSLGLSLLISLPNLIWQISKGFPVFGHMRALNEQQLVNVDRVAFLIDQITMPFMVTIVIVPGLVFLLLNKKYRFLSYTILLVMLILLFLQGKSYYTLGVFPLLAAAGSVAISRFSTNKIYRFCLPFALIVLSIPVLPFGIPIYQQEGMISFFKDLEDDFGLLLGRRFEDGTIHSLPQDYADQLGWKELAAITARAYNQIPEKQKAIIYCENYGQAGAVSIIGKQYDLPEPLSFHESFVYWVPEKFDPEIEYFIYINDELGEDVRELFRDVEIVGSISNEHAREYGTTIYLCSNPKSSFNKFWENVLAGISDEQMF